jgi:hypothetical protein
MQQPPRLATLIFGCSAIHLARPVHPDMMLSMLSHYSNRPMRSTRKYLAGLLLAISVISCTPHSTYAKSDEDVEHYDARVQGFDPDVEQKSSGTGGCWMLMILMGVVCVSVIFKDAKRTHLD